MIELKQISKTYGTIIAVKNISFTVKEQENLVLLGTSGCGKTTTLKMINRLIEPDQGTITIGGKAIGAENPETLRRGIGYVMQNIGLFPHYTIAENIGVSLKLLKWDKEKIHDRVLELLKKLHLPADCLNLFPHELSGGQQQRVGLARALAADPPVLLMDEPFGALDNVTRASIQEEFKALEELKRKTIVMVTHDVQEAFELADRICLMDQGEIVQIGTPQDLLYRPVNDFAKKFLDAQRLALEFKAVRLKDIWSSLPAHHLEPGHITSGQTKPDEETARSASLSLPTTTSVWTALEQLRLSGKDQLIVFEAEKGEKKTVSFQELANGFYHYQKINHE